MLKLTLLAAGGGAIGAAGRFLVGTAAVRIFGFGFPWGTLIVNIAGSFAMGLLVGLFALRVSGGESMRVFLAVGVLGGFTTFSAFSLDFVSLVERKAHGLAMLYAGASVCVSILALMTGLWLARQGVR